VLIPKLKLAAQEFDMVPQPQHPHFEPQPWAQDDDRLPGKLEPYFLRNDSGPKYLLGGMLCTPLATTAESDGRFCVGSVEGSSFHSSASLFANGKSIIFNTTHHCVQIVDGRVDFVVNGAKGSLATGETLFIPAGIEFCFEFSSCLAKMYVFSNGGGLVELLCKLGMEYQAPVLPVKAAAWDSSNLSRYGKKLDYSLSP
jgi:mannose-6-phosphate isomerase-like protein (cupin superfamily)